MIYIIFFCHCNWRNISTKRNETVSGELRWVVAIKHDPQEEQPSTFVLMLFCSFSMLIGLCAQTFIYTIIYTIILKYSWANFIILKKILFMRLHYGK